MEHLFEKYILKQFLQFKRCLYPDKNLYFIEYNFKKNFKSYDSRLFYVFHSICNHPYFNDFLDNRINGFTLKRYEEQFKARPDYLEQMEMIGYQSTFEETRINAFSSKYHRYGPAKHTVVGSANKRKCFKYKLMKEIKKGFYTSQIGKSFIFVQEFNFYSCHRCRSDAPVGPEP